MHMSLRKLSYIFALNFAGISLTLLVATQFH